MQCFICVTYLMIICSAYPPKSREVSKVLEKRSLFRDVIESLRIRAQFPEDFNPNEVNNLSQNYARYGFENELLQMPGDSEFMPRRNDRIEMPSLNYRYPKSLLINDTIREGKPKEEIVLYIDSPDETTIKAFTQKPKKQKLPRPSLSKKPNKEIDTTEDTENNTDTNRPSNNLAGQSQIGNRDSQTVIKPTVIVNFRGTVNHRESEIRLERKSNNDTKSDTPLNVFNIRQEVSLERPRLNKGTKGNKKEQNTKVVGDDENAKIEEDMMMCESNSREKNKDRINRKYEVLQILLSI